MSLLHRAIRKCRHEGLIGFLSVAPRAVRNLAVESQHDVELDYRNRSKDSLRKGGYTKTKQVSPLLRNIIEDKIGPEASVLELGCNAGTHLGHFTESSTFELAGIELNPNAIELMADEFPDTATQTDTHLGRVQDILPEFESNSVDAVYSVAVLQHIPEPEDLYDQISRVAKDLLIIVEAESTSDHFSDEAYTYRNYRTIFENLGWEPFISLEMGDSIPPRYDGSLREYKGYTLRAFQR